jgi:prepilin-type N-terminal cleavage/methylation domain-containing protein
MNSEKGFTLVELMIVIVILGILATIAIPRFSSVISRSKITEAKTILNQIINLERVYFSSNHVYIAFAEGAPCAEINFTQPDKRRFEYNTISLSYIK